MTTHNGSRQARLTVVIATRDRPQLLRKALAAVEAQTAEGVIETVVVFDRSRPDRSLERGGDRPVRVVSNERTPGLAGARNTGVRWASAPVVAFCDDDDEWRPTKAQRQLTLLDWRPGVDVVATGIAIEYRGRITERVPPGEITFADLLRSRVMEAHPSTIMVRTGAFLGRIGDVDEAIPGGYGEDYEWVLRAARHAPISTVAEPLTLVRWGPGSYFAGRWETIDHALGYLLAKYPEFDDEPRGLARVLGQRAFAAASAGRSDDGRRLALRTLKASWRQPRGYLALAVSTGLLKPDWVLGALHRAGRGI